MGIIKSDADLAAAWGMGYNADAFSANPFGKPAHDLTPLALLARLQGELLDLPPYSPQDDDNYRARPSYGERIVAAHGVVPDGGTKGPAYRQMVALENIAATLDQLWILFRDKENHG